MYINICAHPQWVPCLLALLLDPCLWRPLLDPPFAAGQILNLSVGILGVNGAVGIELIRRLIIQYQTRVCQRVH